MKIKICGAMLAALAFGFSASAYAAHGSEAAPAGAPTVSTKPTAGTKTSAGAKTSPATGSALHKGVTLEILKAAANWAGIPNKIAQASPTVPFIALLSSSGAEVAYIAMYGCEKGVCEGYSIFSIVKAGVLSPATIAAYNSKFSYTRLTPLTGGVNFEQQVLAAGGVTDDNIHANLFVFFKNMDSLTSMLKQPSAQLDAPGSATATFAETQAPGALTGFAESLAPGVFMTGAELEAAARANLLAQHAP